MMKQIFLAILFSVIYSCQVQYNNDILFDFTNIQAIGLPFAQNGDTLYLTLCGLLDYQCSLPKSTLRILEETELDTTTTTTDQTSSTTTTQTDTTTTDTNTKVDTNTTDQTTTTTDTTTTTTTTDTPTTTTTTDTTTTTTTEEKPKDDENDDDDKEDHYVLKQIDKDQSQSLIVNKKDNCIPYSEQNGVDQNQLKLLKENKPLEGIIVERRGIVEKDTIKLLLYCSDNVDIEIENQKNEDDYLFILSSYYACPKLVYNPVTQFFIDFKWMFSIILWVIGIFLLVLGYQLAQLSSMIMAAVMGFGFTTLILGEATLNTNSSNAALCVVIGSGIVVSFIYFNASMSRFFFLLFNFGFSVGIVISLMIQSLYYYQIQTELMYFPLTTSILVLGIILGLLGIKYNLIMGMISTSLVGAYCLIRPIGFIVGGYPNELIITKQFEYGFNVKITSTVYVYNIIILIIAGLCSFYQRRQHLKRISLDDQIKQDIQYYEMGNVDEEDKQRKSKNSDQNVTIIFPNNFEEMKEKKRLSHLTGSDL